jgi:hypothetical protein
MTRELLRTARALPRIHPHAFKAPHHHPSFEMNPAGISCCQAPTRTHVHTLPQLKNRSCMAPALMRSHSATHATTRAVTVPALLTCQTVTVPPWLTHQVALLMRMALLRCSSAIEEMLGVTYAVADARTVCVHRPATQPPCLMWHMLCRCHLVFCQRT